MKGFSDIQMKQHPMHTEGIIGRMFFKNGYGVSVVMHPYSYGGNRGLYEVAILSSDGMITYDTPITDDVIGYLTESEVTDIMHKVQLLKKWKVVLNNFIKSIFK